MDLARIISQKKRDVDQRGLGQFPQSNDDENLMAVGISALFRVLKTPPIIQHGLTGLSIELDPIIGPRLSYLICVEDYEQSDLLLIDKHIKPGDVVLNIGGGIGLVGAYCAKKSRSAAIMVEPDERLHPVIARNFALNGLEHHLEFGCVTNSVRKKFVDLYIADEIWFTNSQSPSQANTSKTVTVPNLEFNALLAKWKPSVLFMDIEGAEQNLFKKSLSHFPDRLMIEIHVPIIGEEKSSTLIKEISSLGYFLSDFKGWTFVFKKGSK